MEFLEQTVQVEQRIQDLEGADDLPRARELLMELEQLETRWWMVDEPRLSRAVELEEMENTALELDDPELFRMVRQARRAHERDVEMARQLYEAWERRAETERGLDTTARQFWSRASVLRRHADEDDDEDVAGGELDELEHGDEEGQLTDEDDD
jgi:hypothetical protein